MRINEAKITRSMFNEIRLPDCDWFRDTAEKVLTLLEREPPIPYKSMEEFNRRVIARYWGRYDGLDLVLAQHGRSRDVIRFEAWLANPEVTDPDKIQRAIRWLIQHGYLIPDPAVKERADRRAETVRGAFGVGNET